MNAQHVLLVALLGQVSGSNPRDGTPCLGEFTRCPAAGPGNSECVMSVDSDCGGPCLNVRFVDPYLCPYQEQASHTCVDGAAALATECASVKGTHYDPALSEDARLDYLVAHT